MRPSARQTPATPYGKGTLQKQTGSFAWWGALFPLLPPAQVPRFGPLLRAPFSLLHGVLPNSNRFLLK